MSKASQRAWLDRPYLRELIEDNLSSKGEPAGFKRAHSGEAESDGDTDLAAGSPLARL